MISRFFRRTSMVLPLLVLLLVSTQAAQADFTYHVDVDTSSIQGTTGYVDLQFNPGSILGTQAATVTILNFASTLATLSSGADVSGDVTGTLPDPVALTNSTILNELTQGIEFGSGFSFDATFNGPAVNSPSNGAFGSTFALSLLGPDEATPLLSDDPSGAILAINLLPDGSSNATAFPPGDGIPPVASATLLSVPEPSSLALTSLGGMAALLLRRGKNRSLLSRRRHRHPNR